MMRILSRLLRTKIVFCLFIGNYDFTLNLWRFLSFNFLFYIAKKVNSFNWGCQITFSEGGYLRLTCDIFGRRHLKIFCKTFAEIIGHTKATGVGYFCNRVLSGE